MTNSEFKAWFEGFTEALAGLPTKTQWDRIKQQVKKIDGEPTTKYVYLNEDWAPRKRWLRDPYIARLKSNDEPYEALTAMRAAGRLAA